MKKILLTLMSCLLLAGCSSAASSVTIKEEVQLSVPQNCENPLVIAAFDAKVEGSMYVPTDWQPSEGTDLYDVYQAQGIACTYGIQSAEIGGTVMWAQSDLGFWNTKKSQWLSQGQREIDISGIDEIDAVILKEGATSADEMHVWGINLFIHGVWIQVGATFLQNIEEAKPIIQAAIDSLSPKASH